MHAMHGPGTSALRSLRERVGYFASFLCVASEQVLRMTRADSAWTGHPKQADLGRAAQPE